MAPQPVLGRFPMKARIAVAAAWLCLAGGTSLQAAAPGLAVNAATARSSAVMGTRIALLIVPQLAAAGSRAATAHSDEEAYRKRLREIGFDVWTLGPADRPQMERSLREAVARLPEDAQIAVFALGPSLGGDDDVYLLPQGSPGDLAHRTSLLESEGLRLGDLMRHLVRRRPRDLVAIVDECQPAAGGRCNLDMATGNSGASIIGAERAALRASGGAPLAGRPSLRDPMLGAMAHEGANFLQSYGALKRALADSDLEPRASGSLSTSFAFLPQNFFSGLRTDCNRIDPNADPAALRTAQLEGAIRACETMIATYPYARSFEDRLQAGREQRAYQRAVSSCDDSLSAAAYGATYPAGRFRTFVDNFVFECGRARDRQLQEEQRRRDEAEARRRQEEQDRLRREADRQREIDAQRQREAELQRLREQEEQRRRDEEERRRREAEMQNQRITARSASGWTLSYASNLLEIKPLGNDNYDAQKQSYSTVWQSRLHGEQVLMYVQVSPNGRCGDARQYISEQIRPRRERITRAQEVNTAPTRWGFVLEGQGTARGQGMFDDRTFMDFVSIRRDDRSTITHIGGRFPQEYSDMYRAELLKMMNSMNLPNADIFTHRCS